MTVALALQGSIIIIFNISAITIKLVNSNLTIKFLVAFLLDNNGEHQLLIVILY